MQMGGMKGGWEETKSMENYSMKRLRKLSHIEIYENLKANSNQNIYSLVHDFMWSSGDKHLYMEWTEVERKPSPQKIT